MQNYATQDDRPFVETSVIRTMLPAMELTHVRRGIAVYTGPYGIGKTTAIRAFLERHNPYCFATKIDQPPRKSGLQPGDVFKLILKNLWELNRKMPPREVRRSPYQMQNDIAIEVENYVNSHSGSITRDTKITFVFDEAQYLSKEAIETLRYWNDEDAPKLGIVIGLIFIGNNELALAAREGEDSVLKGTVRSRLTHEQHFSASLLSDEDIARFCRSRGIDCPHAIAEILRYLNKAPRGRPRPKRDLRPFDRRYFPDMIMRAGDGPITADIVRAALNP